MYIELYYSKFPYKCDLSSTVLFKIISYNFESYVVISKASVSDKTATWKQEIKSGMIF